MKKCVAYQRKSNLYDRCALFILPNIRKKLPVAASAGGKRRIKLRWQKVTR